MTLNLYQSKWHLRPMKEIYLNLLLPGSIAIRELQQILTIEFDL